MGTGTARNSITVAGWTLISRVTGLLRVLVIGATLGATYFANSFQASSTVPAIVFALMAGPVLAMVVVPGLVGALKTGALPRARAVFGRVAGWLIVVSAAISALLMLAAPAVAWTLTRGVPDPAERARGWWLTTLLVVLVAPQILLTSVAYLALSAQRARGRFALSAAAPATENVVLILTVAFTTWRYGSGLDLDRVPLSMVLILGVGSTAGVALHAALQLFGAARVRLIAWPSLRWRQDPDALAVTRRLSRAVGVATLPAAGMYVLMAIAGSVPGGVFVVQMSTSVLFALSYLSARAVSMASLPRLSEAAHQADAALFGSVWRQGLSYALTASLPLLVMLAILAGPTATILANGELQHSMLVGPLGACLAVVAAAQLITGLGDLGNQALYARLEDRVPRWASRVNLVVTVLAGAAGLLVPAGGARLVWLALALLIGELAAAGMVLARIWRIIRPGRFLDSRALRGTLVAAAAMVPVTVLTWWVQHTYFAAANNRLAILGVLIAGGILAVAIYALVLRRAWAGAPGKSTA